MSIIYIERYTSSYRSFFSCFSVSCKDLRMIKASSQEPHFALYALRYYLLTTGDSLSHTDFFLTLGTFSHPYKNLYSCRDLYTTSLDILLCHLARPTTDLLVYALQDLQPIIFDPSTLSPCRSTQYRLYTSIILGSTTLGSHTTAPISWHLLNLPLDDDGVPVTVLSNVVYKRVRTSLKSDIWSSGCLVGPMSMLIDVDRCLLLFCDE